MISQEELKVLYEEKYSKLYIFAAKIIQDQEMAKDIVHDVFIKAWNKIDETILDAGSYLWKSVERTSLDYLKKKKHRIFVDTSEEKYDLPDDVIMVNYKIEAEIVSSLLNELPLKCKNTFLLFMQGLTAKETAKKLGVSQQCALNQKNIAIKKLRQFVFKYNL